MVAGMEVLLLLGERTQATMPVGEEEQVHLGAHCIKSPNEIPKKDLPTGSWVCILEERFGLQRSDLWVAAEILEWVR